ncbi:MAG: NUDIX hydrolase [Acidobacteria bacterium]|nr:NUDIX hydrolase [Acidobacteriota bacterium]MBI3655291.1 NUDIX hydrolase [Acidobacteriota bacterium]
MNSKPKHLYHPHEFTKEKIEAAIKFCPRCAGGLIKQPVPPESKMQLACDACGFIFYLNPKVVGCAIPVLENKVLLLRRNIEPSVGRWTFPGGFVDIGETVAEAAIRETKEEVNVDIEITSLLNVYSYAQAPVVIVVYMAKVIGGEPRTGIEAQGLAYFEYHQIPWNDLAFKNTGDALQAWGKLAGYV